MIAREILELEQQSRKRIEIGVYHPEDITILRLTLEVQHLRQQLESLPLTGKVLPTCFPRTLLNLISPAIRVILVRARHENWDRQTLVASLNQRMADCLSNLPEEWGSHQTVKIDDILQHEISALSIWSVEINLGMSPVVTFKPFERFWIKLNSCDELVMLENDETKQ